MPKFEFKAKATLLRTEMQTSSPFQNGRQKEAKFMEKECSNGQAALAARQKWLHWNQMMLYSRSTTPIYLSKGENFSGQTPWGPDTQIKIKSNF